MSIVSSISKIGLVVLLWSLAGCSDFLESDNINDFQYVSTFDFNVDDQGWTGGFSDYPSGLEDSLQLEVSMSNLPVAGMGGRGLRLSGINPHRDLFYYYCREIRGLSPNTQFLLRFTADFVVERLEELPADAVGDVYFKVGSTTEEPQVTTGESSQNGYRPVEIGLDKGGQPSESGPDMKAIGRVIIPVTSTARTIQASNNQAPILIRSNDEGKIWLVLGFDSSLDVHLAFYLANLSVYYTVL
jgi:hypothetical protein